MPKWAQVRGTNCKGQRDNSPSFQDCFGWVGKLLFQLLLQSFRSLQRDRRRFLAWSFAKRVQERGRQKVSEWRCSISRRHFRLTKQLGTTLKRLDHNMNLDPCYQMKLRRVEEDESVRQKNRPNTRVSREDKRETSILTQETIENDEQNWNVDDLVPSQSNG